MPPLWRLGPIDVEPGFQGRKPDECVVRPFVSYPFTVDRTASISADTTSMSAMPSTDFSIFLA